MPTSKISSLRLFIAVSLFWILIGATVQAQFTGKVISTQAPESKEGSDITIGAEIAPSSDIAEILLFYRQYGQSEYRQTEMINKTTSATGVIPAASVSAPFVEYYILLRMRDGSVETYPLQNAEANPLRVTVLGRSEKDKEVIILSPDKNEQSAIEDLFFSVSLIYASSNVDRKATRLIIDGTDVTSNAIFSDDVLTYFPDNFPGSLSAGPHSYTIELRTPSGELYHRITGSVTVVSPAAMMAAENRFKYGASLQAESRHENISTVGTWYNRASLKLNGGWEGLAMNSYLHFTSEEKVYRQPQNRYSFNAQTSWLKLGLGDVYPLFPTLILNGQRVRGASGSLLLGGFNLDVAYGQTIRSLEGREIARYSVDSLPKDVNGNPTIPLNSQQLPGSLSNYYAQYNYGTFSRNLFAIRPSFGSGEHFQLGFDYLHSMDDKNSVKFGVKPAENVVVGSDLLVGVDNQRLLFTAQGALSIVNNDISSGNITDARIDSLFGDGKPFGGDPQTIKDLRDAASKFITINENLTPLDPSKRGSLSYEAALSFNYFGNYLKAGYISRGGQYQSFGQQYLRTDVQGFNIIDRLRLVENTLYLAGSIEMLKDNLNDTKISTTSYDNYNLSISYYPRFDFPNVTLGVGGYSNANTIDANDPDPVRRASSVNNLTTRIFGQLGYDFTYLARHSSNLSISTLNTDDRTAAKINIKNTVIAAGVTTTYSMPLQTTVNITFNFNTLPANLLTAGTPATSSFNYTSLMLNGLYRLMDDKLNVGATLSPTFGAMKRTLIQLMAQYLFTQRQSLAFEFYLINNPNNPLSKTDTIGSLVYRVDL